MPGFFSGNRQKVIGALVFMLCGLCQNNVAVDTTTYISHAAGEGYFPLSVSGHTAAICLSDNDHTGVMRAAKDLQNDLAKVTGAIPQLYTGNVPEAGYLVMVGTVGKSAVIDRLVENKKIDAWDLKGKWEAFMVEVVDRPLPGVEKALVIAGSDKRGTIFGIYDVSAKIGVSPWYWWADVPVEKQPELYVMPGRYSKGEPAVKYRGIFLNDEAPALTGWVQENFGDYNHDFYVHVFELILRLHGNFMWPAMWNNAFADDDPQNMILADQYGIVMSTSHHEPMMRADKEWDRYGRGPWEYSTNAENIYNFWVEGVKRNKDYESIYTLGMRGQQDRPMSEGENIELLGKIVKDQREILTGVFSDRDITGVPQVWCLYKEVQGYYDKGMRVPEDITLLLCDDNWGNVRVLPEPGSPSRKGGYGMYYHFDFVGGPVSYKWLNVSTLPKIWEQMNLAYRHGVEEIWIVNVGDLKPMEYPIEFFLDLAWDPDKWPAAKLKDYAVLWAKEQFGEEYAEAIGSIMEKYTKFNGRRTPEMLKPDTYSLLNYREAERIVSEYNNIALKAEAINDKLPERYKDAFYQLVLYPVLACANLNEMYVTTGMNYLYHSQRRVKTNELAEKVEKLFKRDKELAGFYHHEIAGGKWNHMMSQPHIGYTSWNQPDSNIMPEVKTIAIPGKAEMGVSIEGSDKWWPEEEGDAVLPVISPYNNDHSYFEIFNRGLESFDYTIETGAEWLTVPSSKGTIEEEQRFTVKVVWEQVPGGKHKIPVTITGSEGSKVTLTALVYSTVAEERDNIAGFVESNGYISFEASNFTRAVDKAPVTWKIIPDLGRTGSSVTAFPVTAPAQTPGGKSPHLEYDIYTFTGGEAEIHVLVSPTLNFQGGDGLKFGLSLDDDPVEIINIHEGDTVPDWQYPRWWNESVTNHVKELISKKTPDKPGRHTLRIWMADPGIVFQKIMIDLGGLKPAYLGPPESMYVSREE
ncbi:MAG: glycosyl hydrolase 115 family protein [Bacteroidales bacterium]|nr:glycosyl hydrolase 115 family protein [Bacteroidales bacterium]